MKINIRQNIQIVAGFLLLVFIAISCNEKNDLGIEILPGEDLINVKNIVIRNDISAFTYTEDSIVTSGKEKSLLGSLNDPVFGKTTVDFATQFRLKSYPDFGSNPVADSVKLYLYYRFIYGDTETPQRLRVYELESALDADAQYNQYTDLKSMASVQLLGEIDYTPVVEIDTTKNDTFIQGIVIPLDISLAEKLITADSLDLINNDVFLEYFKGLYIEAEEQNNVGGTLLSLEATGSALAVYYNNDENKAEEEPDTLYMPFVISQFSAQVNSITHDYSGTKFESNLNQNAFGDSLIYIQPTGGLKSLIQIDGLTSWNDSVNTAINRAELVFRVDSIASGLDKFAPPSQLLFTFIDDDGKERLPIDYYFNPGFYGGQLYQDKTYRFNITQHLQQIIEGNVANNGFYLTTGQRSDMANRVVLKGATSNSGIELIITYSKFLQ
ncbi:MAG: DUF4270 domain-containing protein [Bacteroidota bacterium]